MHHGCRGKSAEHLPAGGQLVGHDRRARQAGGKVRLGRPSLQRHRRARQKFQPLQQRQKLGQIAFRPPALAAPDDRRRHPSPRQQKPERPAQQVRPRVGQPGKQRPPRLARRQLRQSRPLRVRRQPPEPVIPHAHLGRHRGQLAIAESWGIATALAEEKLAATQADVVVECSGQPTGFALASHLLRPAGTLVMKSTYHGSQEMDMSALVVNEVTLVGSRCGPFAPALRLLAGGLVDPTPLISARYPLAEGVAALHYAMTPGVLKVLLVP